MRFFVFAVLLCLVCLSYGQEPNPTQLDTQPDAQAKPSPFSHIFFWFKKPEKQVTADIASVPNPTAKDEFESPLPQESTDRMISNAISDRILEESRVQQVVSGSPFIEDKHFDHQPSASETDLKQVASPSDREGYGKSMANTPTESIPLAEALRIVNSSNLSDCVARVICELSCNANAYGNEGRVVFRNLIKLQFDQSIKSDDAKFFRQAAAKGRQIIQGKRDCQECYTIYSSCKSSSKDLIAVSSMFKL